MMLKRIIFSLHICILILAIILLTCNRISVGNYQYIYNLSLLQITKYRFDSFIFATLCAVILMIVDIIYVIKYLFFIYKKDNTKALKKKIIYNAILTITMAISVIIYFNQYIIFLC